MIRVLSLIQKKNQKSREYLTSIAIHRHLDSKNLMKGMRKQSILILSDSE